MNLLQRLFLTSVLAAPVAAQGPIFKWTDDPRFPAAESGFTFAGPVTRSCVGEFTGDGVRDAAFLVNGRVLLCSAPAVWSATVAGGVLPGAHNINDIAAEVNPDLTTRGNVVFVNAGGLKRMLLEGPGDEDLSPIFPFQVIDGSASWQGAKRIVCQVRGAVSTYVGVAADGLTLLFREQTGASVQTRSLTLASEILDLDLLRWDGDTGLELAVVTTGGLEIHDLFPTQNPTVPLRTVAHAEFGIASLAIVQSSPTAQQRVAWLRSSISGPPAYTQEIAVARNASTTVTVYPILAEEGETPDALMIAGVNGADQSGPGIGQVDGDTDLLVLREDSDRPWILQNTGGSSWFSWEDREQLPSGTTSPGSFAEPAVADFDGDGVDDVLLACPGTNDFLFHRGGVLPTGPQNVVCADCIGNGQFDAISVYTVDDLVNPQGNFSLGVALTIPNSGSLLHPLVVNEEDFNAIQVIAWYQAFDFTGGMWSYGNLRCISHQIFDVTELEGILQMPVPFQREAEGSTLGPVNPDGFECATNEDPSFNDVIWLEVRALLLETPSNPQSAVLWTGPTWTAFAFNQNEVVRDHPQGDPPTTLPGLGTGQSGYLRLVAPCNSDVPELGGMTPTPSPNLNLGTRRKPAPSGIPATTMPAPKPAVQGTPVPNN
ncbi:MAG: VCBS repeat-containing protein [Planctomycetes bacterium]|nr:VCBS repeat-containing protein [Planctomycetota bacterium]